jgi:hypothetical protein
MPELGGAFMQCAGAFVVLFSAAAEPVAFAQVVKPISEAGSSRCLKQLRRGLSAVRLSVASLYGDAQIDLCGGETGVCAGAEALRRRARIALEAAAPLPLQHAEIVLRDGIGRDGFKRRACILEPLRLKRVDPTLQRLCGADLRGRRG